MRAAGAMREVYEKGVMEDYNIAPVLYEVFNDEYVSRRVRENPGGRGAHFHSEMDSRDIHFGTQRI